MAKKKVRNKKHTPKSSRKGAPNETYNANRRAQRAKNKHTIHQDQFDDLWTQIGIKNSLLSDKQAEIVQLRTQKDAEIEQLRFQLLQAQEKFAKDEPMPMIDEEKKGGDYIDIHVKMNKEEFEKKQMMHMFKMTSRAGASIKRLDVSLKNVMENWFDIIDWDCDENKRFQTYSKSTCQLYIQYKLLVLDLMVISLRFITVITSKSMTVGWDETKKQSKLYEAIVAFYRDAITKKIEAIGIGYVCMYGKNAEGGIHAIFRAFDCLNEFIFWWKKENNLSLLLQCYDISELCFDDLYIRFRAALSDRNKTNDPIFIGLKERFINLLKLLQCTQHDVDNGFGVMIEWLESKREENMASGLWKINNSLKYWCKLLKPGNEYAHEKSGLFMAIMKHEKSEVGFLHAVEDVKSFKHARAARRIDVAQNAAPILSSMSNFESLCNKKYGGNPIFSSATSQMVEIFCSNEWSKKEMSTVAFNKIHFVDEFCGWSTKSDIVDIGPEIQCVINGIEAIVEDRNHLFGVILGWEKLSTLFKQQNKYLKMGVMCYPDITHLMDCDELDFTDEIFLDNEEFTFAITSLILHVIANWCGVWYERPERDVLNKNIRFKCDEIIEYDLFRRGELREGDMENAEFLYPNGRDFMGTVWREDPLTDLEFEHLLEQPLAQNIYKKWPKDVLNAYKDMIKNEVELDDTGFLVCDANIVSDENSDNDIMMEMDEETCGALADVDENIIFDQNIDGEIDDSCDDSDDDGYDGYNAGIDEDKNIEYNMTTVVGDDIDWESYSTADSNDTKDELLEYYWAIIREKYKTSVDRECVKQEMVGNKASNKYKLVWDKKCRQNGLLHFLLENEYSTVLEHFDLYIEGLKIMVKYCHKSHAKWKDKMSDIEYNNYIEAPTVSHAMESMHGSGSNTKHDRNRCADNTLQGIVLERFDKNLDYLDGLRKNEKTRPLYDHIVTSVKNDNTQQRIRDYQEEQWDINDLMMKNFTSGPFNGKIYC